MNNRKRIGIVSSIILLVVVATVIVFIATNSATETTAEPEPAVSATSQPDDASPSVPTESSDAGTPTDPSATTAPENQPEPSKQPAPPPPPDDYITTSGCLRGYGEPGQCVPAYYPDTDGNPSPVTCQDLRSAFPKGFKAAQGDPAGLDLNGDGTACGEDE